MVVSVVTGPIIQYDLEIEKFKASQAAKEVNIKTVRTPAEFSAAVRSTKLTVVNFYKESGRVLYVLLECVDDLQF